MRKLLAALALLALAAPAHAQTAPFVYALTVGTGSAQILPANPQRRKLIFQNPSATASVAVCPAGPTRPSGAALTAAVNGAGCATLLPYGSMQIDGAWGNGPGLSMGSAWIAAASGASSPLTVWEFE